MADNKTMNKHVKNAYEMLEAAAAPGGPQALTATTNLKPAGGFGRLVAPARYSFGKDSKKSGSTYVFERRFLLAEGRSIYSGRAMNTVLLDSRESNANRMEEAIRMAAEIEGHVFSKMPSIEVAYGEGEEQEIFRDYELPHRAFDAHIRFAKFEDEDGECYKRARKATPRDAGALFDISPITVLLGGWDSTGGCVKFPALVVGETFGVLADQSCGQEDAIRRRHGARLDPVSPNFEPLAFTSGELGGTAEEGNTKIIVEDKDGKKKGGKEASALNLGHIPPATDGTDGVAVSSIVRHNVLQFGALRRLHFGKGSEGDRAIRTLLAAMAIDAMVRAGGELFLRANAQLVFAGSACDWVVDDANGGEGFCKSLSIEEADALLTRAYGGAKDAGAVDDWESKPVLQVKGNETIYNSRKVEEEEDGKTAKKS